MAKTDDKRKKKISDELEEKLKRIYPESRSLEIDRQFRAEETVDPSDQIGLRRWQERPTRMDVEGFDTPDAREPTPNEVMRLIEGRPKGKDYIKMREIDGHAPDSFVEPTFEAGRLIAKKKEKIVDFESMKNAVREAWKEDGNLISLLPYLTDRDYEVLYNHPTMQSYIQDNIKPFLINFVMKRYGVEPIRASKIVGRLSSQQRNKLYEKAREQKIPRLIVKGATIRRRTKSTLESKKKRSRWSQEEINFIRQNRGLSPERLFEAFNRVFSNKRSFSAVRNRLYRERKS